MDLSHFNCFFDWIAVHPGWTGLVVFLLSFGESLAVVGLFLPGAALMLAVGALVGTGDLPLWPTVGWCVAGAIAGDGVSFWIGKRFHERLNGLWPFRRYPELIPRATVFMDRHGGKSILFARFVGPLRPVVPAVAGMVDMPVGRFVFANVLSACAWAPAYLLPGAIVGASLDMVAEVTTRLAVLIMVIVTVVIMVSWLARDIFNRLHPHAHAMLSRWLAWAQLHPVAGQIPASLLDPQHREAKGLTVLALILVVAAGAFFLLIHAVAGGGLIFSVDVYVFHALQNVRTPWMDRLMAVITGFGDWQVLLPLFGTILLWLGWQRRWKAAAYWFLAAGFALVLTQVLKISMGVLRPHATFDGFSAFSFPSGHAVLSTVVYGFLAVLFARELSIRFRATAYAVAAVVVMAIALSRLYLGVHWLSDVLAGLCLGLVWVTLLGIAYCSHPAATLPLRGLAIASALAVGIASILHLPASLSGAEVGYISEQSEVRMGRYEWWNRGWSALPPFRADLRVNRRQPLNVQYAGGLEALQSVLARKGWHPPAKLSGASWLAWFGFRHEIARLPILPQVHDGRHEALLLVQPIKARNDRMWALRLWQSGVILGPRTVPLWVGNVAQMGLYRPLPGFAAPRGVDLFDAARLHLDSDLGDLTRRTDQRRDGPFAGEVLLVIGDPQMGRGGESR